MELASESAAYCGKLLADFGADVILVEPIEGHPTRHYEPFVDELPDPERSLWFWHYNTSKAGVILDLEDAEQRDLFRSVVSRADVVLEAEPPGRLRRLGVDHPDLETANPGLVWVSVTPFGRTDPRSGDPVTDLTLLAGGGPVWNCGYDDHSVPPVRGGGNQAFHIASVWAAVATLVAVNARELSGQGQLVDVSIHTAANVTTEQASYNWLVAQTTVRRQTARHAAPTVTAEVIALDREGRPVHTGLPPRSPDQLRKLLAWVDDLDATEELSDRIVIELAIEAGGIDPAKLADDPMTQEYQQAAREALVLIASKLADYEFFIQGQQRGISLGVIYTPEEAMTDRHLVERGFPVDVWHDTLGRAVTYPGAPIRFTRSPWRIRHRAPALGEHQHLLGDLLKVDNAKAKMDGGRTIAGREGKQR